MRPSFNLLGDLPSSGEPGRTAHHFAGNVSLAGTPESHCAAQASAPSRLWSIPNRSGPSPAPGSSSQRSRSPPLQKDRVTSYAHRGSSVNCRCASGRKTAGGAPPLPCLRGVPSRTRTSSRGRTCPAARVGSRSRVGEKARHGSAAAPAAVRSLAHPGRAAGPPRTGDAAAGPGGRAAEGRGSAFIR